MGSHLGKRYFSVINGRGKFNNKSKITQFMELPSGVHAKYFFLLKEMQKLVRKLVLKMWQWS